MLAHLMSFAASLMCCKPQQEEEEEQEEFIEMERRCPESDVDQYEHEAEQRREYQETESEPDVKFLESQASGHTMLLSYKGRHILKACAEREARFYEDMPLLLAPAVPKCCVTFMDGTRHHTNGCCKQCSMENSPIVLSQAVMEEFKVFKRISRYSLIMQNLTDGFERPSVLDLKLGTRQHGDGASEKKIKSMTEKCEKSTSAALGVRLGGMKKIDINGELIVVDKIMGRQLDAEGLQNVINIFFEGSSQIEIVKKKIVEIKKIIELFLYLRLYGSSLLIIIESPSTKSSEPVEPQVKIVDFANVSLKGFFGSEEHIGVDHGTIKGLSTILKMLDSI